MISALSITAEFVNQYSHDFQLTLTAWEQEHIKGSHHRYNPFDFVLPNLIDNKSCHMSGRKYALMRLIVRFAYNHRLQVFLFTSLTVH